MISSHCQLLVETMRRNWVSQVFRCYETLPQAASFSFTCEVEFLYDTNHNRKHQCSVKLIYHSLQSLLIWMLCLLGLFSTGLSIIEQPRLFSISSCLFCETGFIQSWNLKIEIPRPEEVIENKYSQKVFGKVMEIVSTNIFRVYMWFSWAWQRKF